MGFRKEITGFGRALGVLGALIAFLPWGPAASAGAVLAADSTSTDSTTQAAPPAAKAHPKKATPKKAAPQAVRPAYPTLVYAKAYYESLLSVNDRCPVRGGRLNPNVRPMYINRQPVGFC